MQFPKFFVYLHCKTNKIASMNNKTKIEIVWIKDMGRNHNLFCETILGLRNARKVGDVEIINNTVLGKIKRNNYNIIIKVIN